MEYDFDGTTLEEGRIALQELEKYLKEREEFPDGGSVEKQIIRIEDRKLMDHVPRNERLRHIKGSPLGLTLEELDDRGLIDGGGSLPSHSSSIQRSRRPLEMKQRSSRMKDRENGQSKGLHSFFHMMRLLTKRGLNIEEYCRQRDISGRGLMDKRKFASMLRKLSLPFGSRELNEIRHRYTVVNTDQVDYEAMLRDAGVLDTTEVGVEMDESVDGIGNFASIIAEVKGMLIDSMDSLGKTPEEVYHMFAQWDRDGTGTVTATQFLRVLSRLHVSLDDNDQDFLVELLDTDHMGRVRYDGIMNYCLNVDENRNIPVVCRSTSSGSFNSPQPIESSSNSNGNKPTGSGSGITNPTGVDTVGLRPTTATTSGAIIGDDTATNNETLSMMSQTASMTDLLSGGATANNTAGNLELQHSGSNSSFVHNKRPHTASRVPTEIVAFDNLSPLRGPPSNLMRNSTGTGGLNEQYMGSNRVQRPLTASGRVSYSYQQDYNVPNTRNPVQNSNNPSRSRPESAHQYVVDIGDNNDVINDDSYMQMTPASGLGDSTIKSTFEFQQPYRNVSFQGQGLSVQNDYGTQDMGDIQQQASMCLLSMRQAIFNRARGVNINDRYVLDVFKQFFDREGILYFRTHQLILAFRDLLNTELSTKLADMMIASMALDGGDHVSFGEFSVFMLDPEHQSLVNNLINHCTGQFLIRGREYQAYLYNIVNRSSGDRKNSNSNGNGMHYDQDESGLMSVHLFSEVLSILSNGMLSREDIDRLVRRFNIHGSGHCVISRFLKVIVQSKVWKQAEKIVATQEGAAEEGDMIRKAVASGQQHTLNFVPAALLQQENRTGLDDFISMAEYLGVRLLSERHLHWIVHEALAAPLPDTWVIQTNGAGDTYYYDKNNGQSQQSHPLDSYFFQLIEDYRQGNANVNSNNNANMYSMQNNQLTNQGNHGTNLHYNPSINHNQHSNHQHTNSNSNLNQNPNSSSISMEHGDSGNAGAGAGALNTTTPLLQQLNTNTNKSENLLRQLMQGQLPQQHPAVSESTLRKKFATIHSGVQQLQQQRSHQAHGGFANKTTSSKSYANVGHYDNFGRFHKAKPVQRPQSGTILNRNSRSDLSVVDRVVNVSNNGNLPNINKGDVEKPSIGGNGNNHTNQRRAVSAGRIRPASSNGIGSNHRLNSSTDVTKKLEQMYSNNVINKLDAAMMHSRSNVHIQNDKSSITLEHVPNNSSNNTGRPASGGLPNNSGRGGIVVLQG